MRSHHGPTRCGISCEPCRFVLGGAPPKLTDIRVVQDPGAKGLKGDDYIHLEVFPFAFFVQFKFQKQFQVQFGYLTSPAKNLLMLVVSCLLTWGRQPSISLLVLQVC